MWRDDAVIGGLRGPTQDLQGLLRYLESRSGLGCDDASYCRHKIREVLRQLKSWQRLLAQVGCDERCDQATWWN